MDIPLESVLQPNFTEYADKVKSAGFSTGLQISADEDCFDKLCRQGIPGPAAARIYSIACSKALIERAGGVQRGYLLALHVVPSNGAALLF
jgi:hypothetical protein